MAHALTFGMSHFDPHQGFPVFKNNVRMRINESYGSKHFIYPIQIAIGLKKVL